MLRILFYDAYCKMGFYGAQQTMYEIIKGLKEEIEPVVMAPHWGPLLDKVKAQGFQTALMPYPTGLDVYQGEFRQNSRLKKAMSSMDLIKYNWEVARFIKKERIDLVYCNNLRAVLSIGIGAKLSRLPIVWYIQSVFVRGSWNTLALRLANRVLTISNSAQNIFSESQRQRYRHKISTIYLGLDIERFDAAMSYRMNEQRLENTPFIIGIVAALTPGKGQHILLESFKNLLDQFPHNNQIALWLIGDASCGTEAYRDALVTRTQQWQIQNRVKFWGWQDDIPSLLKQMALLVLPSMSEGVPRCLIEAMAVSLPVVATDVGGIPELVVDGVTGLIVPPNDVDALQDALLDLMRNKKKARAMGLQGRQRVEEKFTSEHFVGAFNDLFLSMMK